MTTAKQKESEPSPANCGPPRPNLEAIALEIARALVPEAIAPEIARALVPPLKRLLAMQAERDEWISHREKHAVAKRIRCRLCKDLQSRGDERAVIRGRDYLLRRSAIDEYLRGQPRPAAESLPLAEQESAGDRLWRKIEARRATTTQGKR